MNKKKLLQKILSGSKNIPYDDMKLLVEAFGFKLSRITGSHHIYTHPDINELVNLQKVDGKAKPYQIKQFIRIIEKYGLDMED